MRAKSLRQGIRTTRYSPVQAASVQSAVSSRPFAPPVQTKSWEHDREQEDHSPLEIVGRANHRLSSLTIGPTNIGEASPIPVKINTTRHGEGTYQPSIQPKLRTESVRQHETVQLWPDKATKHLKDRAAERGISEQQAEDAVASGDLYDDPDYPGGTVYYNPSTKVVVCAASDGTKTTCYTSARPKSRWTKR